MLQADEQLGFRQNDGKPAKQSGHKNCAQQRVGQDWVFGGQPVICKACDIFKRSCKNPHAQTQAVAKQASLHRDDYYRE